MWTVEGELNVHSGTAQVCRVSYTRQNILWHRQNEPWVCPILCYAYSIPLFFFFISFHFIHYIFIYSI